MPKVSGIPKVKFNLDKEVNGECYILLTFRYGGEKLKRSTGEKIAPKYWDAETQRATLNKSDKTKHVRVNDQLDAFTAVVIQIYRDFNLGGISLEDFKNEIDFRMEFKSRPTAEKVVVPTLFEFIENEFLPEHSAQAYSTFQAYKSVFNHLTAYAKEKRGGRLNYEDLDFKFFVNFKKWLHDAPRSHSISTAAKTIKRVKQITRAAHERRYHNITDYQGVKTETSKTSKFALTFDELETLYHLDLSGNVRLEKVRDLFLIGAYTGLRFSDFTRIRPEHIETIDGKKILTITTQKTGQVVSIPLFPIPAALLLKYDYHPPLISNQKMNDYLKELGQLAGMKDKMIVSNTAGGKRNEQVLEKWERLTTHVARRSFATNFYRDGVQPAILMKITGHSTDRQFMQYIAIDGKMNALHFAELRKSESPLKAVI